MEPGQRKRVCRHDASHVQVEKIAAAGADGTLFAGMSAKGKKGLTVRWSRVKGAEGYDVFFAKCNTSRKIHTFKKVKTMKGGKKLSWTKTGLKKGTACKAYVKAWARKGGKKVYIEKNPTLHGYAGGYSRKYTNAKSVNLKSKKNVTLKVGRTSKIRAKVKKLRKNRKLISKKHAPRLRYLSTDQKIAVVTRDGRITAKGRGTCRIYVYAANGVYKTVRVTVRKTGYEVMRVLKSHPEPEDGAVYQFILKKESEGKPKKVAKMAGLNKFLRIYYARVMEVYNC